MGFLLFRRGGQAADVQTPPTAPAPKAETPIREKPAGRIVTINLDDLDGCDAEVKEVFRACGKRWGRGRPKKRADATPMGQTAPAQSPAA